MDRGAAQAREDRDLHQRHDDGPDREMDGARATPQGERPESAAGRPLSMSAARPFARHIDCTPCEPRQTGSARVRGSAASRYTGFSDAVRHAT